MGIEPQRHARSGPARWATRPAEWRQPSGLGAATALLDPLRDQRLVCTSHPAQLGHGLPSGLVFRAPMAGRAEREPGNLRQQIATAPGDLSQLRRSGGVLGFGQPPTGRAGGQYPTGER